MNNISICNYPVKINDITSIVATHEREKSLNNLIKSFQQFYPGLKFIVVDSSKEKYYREDVTYIGVPYNSGISYQRNLALSKVKTDLFLLLDDDFECRYETDLLKMMNYVINNKFSIMGGSINNIGEEQYEFHGTYEIIGDILYHYIGIENKKSDSENKFYDIIFNFFVANTNEIKSMGGWDNKLKFAKEHDDFFLQAMMQSINTGYIGKSLINHYHIKKHHGGEKSIECNNYFCKKWGISDKIEVRHIYKKGSEYINYHHCINNDKKTIPLGIQKKIKQLYGNLPIIIS